jgi:ABC-type lipoprotein export system ATPase subunit
MPESFSKLMKIMKEAKTQQVPLRYDHDKEPVFLIDNLECSYSEGTVVLKAKDINIPRNAVTILLGPSGSGKSTLLESLGLMSKTIDSESTRLTFFPEPGKKGYPFEQLWLDKNKDLLSKIRQDYFSFIFQSTNLMSNFTAIENVTLTDLIVEGYSFAIYKAITTSVRTQHRQHRFDCLLHIPATLKSRLQGLQSPSVLFGDEPTGNLTISTTNSCCSSRNSS